MEGREQVVDTKETHLNTSNAIVTRSIELTVTANLNTALSVPF
jgi:hypothetical protein